MDALEQPRLQRALEAAVRERAARRGREPHVLGRGVVVHAVEVVEAARELVVFIRRAMVNVEVDAVDRRVAEGAEHVAAAAPEVRVPEVVRDGLRRRRGREGVVGAPAADGEEHRDALGLAVLDVGADAVERVAREVGPVFTVAEDAEEGDDHGVVQPGVAGLAQGALVLVPAPEHRQLAGPLGPGGRGSEVQQASEGEEEQP